MEHHLSRDGACFSGFLSAKMCGLSRQVVTHGSDLLTGFTVYCNFINVC